MMKVTQACKSPYFRVWVNTPEPLVTALAAQLDGSPQLSAALRADFMRNNALALFPKFA